MVQVTLISHSINFRQITGGDGVVPCTGAPVDHR